MVLFLLLFKTETLLWIQFCQITLPKTLKLPKVQFNQNQQAQKRHGTTSIYKLSVKGLMNLSFYSNDVGIQPAEFCVELNFLMWLLRYNWIMASVSTQISVTCVRMRFWCWAGIQAEWLGRNASLRH